jgi:hypothetical protein
MSSKKRPEGTAKVLFDFPEMIGGVEVDFIVMRRPKVRDRVEAAKASTNEGEQAVHLIANLCEVPVDEIMQLDDANWGKLEAQVVAFRQARS